MGKNFLTSNIEQNKGKKKGLVHQADDKKEGKDAVTAPACYMRYICSFNIQNIQDRSITLSIPTGLQTKFCRDYVLNVIAMR